MLILLTKFKFYTPFHDDGNTKSFHNQMKTGQFEFEPEYWMHISAAAKELIRGLLTVNAAQRLTVDQALAHPWVSILASWYGY